MERVNLQSRAREIWFVDADKFAISPKSYAARGRSVLAEKFFRAIEEALVQRRIFFAAKSGEFFELLALLAVQARRHFDEQTREEIAAVAAVDVDDAFAAQLENLAALRSGRHLDVRFAFERRAPGFRRRARRR